jgi:hypothetical protein
MAECKDCIHYQVCSPYTTPNESFPEVGGCKLFKNATGTWKISFDGYYPYCPECGNEPKGRTMTEYCEKCGIKLDKPKECVK